jgi:hypothetical protein
MALPVVQQKTRVTKGGEILYGILSGLIPLLLLGSVTTLAVILTALVRQAFNSDGFFVWQRDVLITLSACMVLALLAYVTSLVVILRRTVGWQRAGLRARSAATLWTLFATAWIVLLPVILAAVIPQHPAP